MSNGTYLTDEEIARLISCSKEMRSKPREMAKVNQNMSQRFSVYSSETGNEFQVFISHSIRMPQDFSIGLMYGDYLLLRVNGFHGTTRKGFYSAAHHAVPHIHTLTAEDVASARKGSPSMITEVPGAYVDLNTARLYFFRQCSIIGFERYFPDCEQTTMFD